MRRLAPAFLIAVALSGCLQPPEFRAVPVKLSYHVYTDRASTPLFAVGYVRSLEFPFCWYMLGTEPSWMESGADVYQVTTSGLRLVDTQRGSQNTDLTRTSYFALAFHGIFANETAEGASTKYALRFWAASHGVNGTIEESTWVNVTVTLAVDEELARSGDCLKGT